LKAEFKLSDEAESDIARIYIYGIERFGETQANRYYNNLFDQFERIAKNPLQYAAVPQIREGYRKCAFQKESIYYREIKGVVVIMRILRYQDIDNIIF